MPEGAIARSIQAVVDTATNATAEGRASGTDLAQSKYNFNYTVFPNDIGMDYMGHYCVININVPTQGIKTDGLDVYAPAGEFGAFFTPLTQVSKLDTLRYGNYTIPGAPNAARRTALSIPRNTRRIAESIALFMPSPLVFTGTNLYEEVSLSALAGKAIGVGVQYIQGGLGPTLTQLLAGLGTFAGSLVSGAGLGQSITNGLGTAGVVTALGTEGGFAALGTAAKLAQTPINPSVEILFANTLQRQFVMEWLLAPRNNIESEAIKKIIRMLRFHAAPEINARTAGFMWIPPADFDITFFNKGVENTNILRINTCVLERCEVQYDPTGVYSTFRNGHPVSVRLSLAFRELEPVHKLRVLQGF